MQSSGLRVTVTPEAPALGQADDGREGMSPPAHAGEDLPPTQAAWGGGVGGNGRWMWGGWGVMGDGCGGVGGVMGAGCGGGWGVMGDGYGGVGGGNGRWMWGFGG